MSMHYKRITAVAIMAVFALGLTTCKKEKEEKIDPPTVKVLDGVITINYNKASVSAEVTDQGSAEVKLKGFVYGISDSSLDTVFCGSGTGVYSAELNNLEPNTTYVYEAFAKNSGGIGTSGKVSFTTKPLPSYSIDVSANPSHGGTATGAGTFQEGQSCTVKATANTGFSFIKWTENDTQVSTNGEYTFNVTSNRNLVAHFSAHAYTIIATPDPENGGTISGSGGYNYGDQCTLTATANPGFTFDKWTENGSQVSTNATYSFDVTGNRNLIAHFTLKTYTITATAEPTEYGTVTVSGNGQFHYGDQCTLTATPKPNYSFVNWSKNGNHFSTQATCHIEVTESAEYVAHFQLPGLNLNVSANPTVIAQSSSSQLKAVASGGNGSYTYSWSPSTDLNNAHIQNPTATPTTTKTYTCTVTSGSQTVSGTCKVTVVCPPTNLSATVQNGNNVYLSWTAADPAISYKVYRDNTLIQSNVTTTHYTDSNFSPGTYTYRVSTVYNNVESPKSNSASATVTPQAPTGAINGLFSVSATQQVWFSQGNLQYVGTTQKWKFADNQWQVIGSSQGNSAQSTTRDLFGWGTSGWNCGNTYYRPWDTNNNCSGSSYGPPGIFNLTGSYANSDWGVYNTIYSGNTATTGWRTLKRSEWSYVFDTRTTISGIRYAKAKVNNVNGVILLPDKWSTSYYSLSNTNSIGASFSSNTITAAQWAALEQHGAVFLPAAGYRSGTLVSSAGSYGYYWSASCSDSYSAYYVNFYDGNLDTNSGTSRYYGRSVRLVRSAQ